MKLLAIDLGYSAVKIAYFNSDGVLNFDKYPSAVAKIPTPMEADDDIMFSLGTNFYVLGTSALKVDKNYLLSLEDYESMKQAYPVWISYLLKKYDTESKKFDKIVIGLSMAFSDKADDLLEYLYTTLAIDKNSNYFICLPQGLSCKLAYSECGLDIRESSKHNDFRMRNYLILDGGFNTCDVCSVVNGTAAAGGAVGIPNTGIICIAYNVIDYLRKNYNVEVSLAKARNIIDDNGQLIRRGQKIDISAKIYEFVKSYISMVLTMLEEKFSGAIDAVEGILVCGGLAYFFKKYIDDKDVIDIIEKHFPISFLHFPVVDSEYFNAYSYLRLGQKMLNDD